MLFHSLMLTLSCQKPMKSNFCTFTSAAAAATSSSASTRIGPTLETAAASGPEATTPTAQPWPEATEENSRPEAKPITALPGPEATEGVRPSEGARPAEGARLEEATSAEGTRAAKPLPRPLAGLRPPPRALPFAFRCGPTTFDESEELELPESDDFDSDDATISRAWAHASSTTDCRREQRIIDKT